MIWWTGMILHFLFSASVIQWFFSAINDIHMDFDYNITDDINECKIQKGMLLQPAMNSAYCEQCLVLGK